MCWNAFTRSQAPVLHTARTCEWPTVIHPVCLYLYTRPNKAPFIKGLSANSLIEQWCNVSLNLMLRCCGTFWQTWPTSETRGNKSHSSLLPLIQRAMQVWSFHTDDSRIRGQLLFCSLLYTWQPAPDTSTELRGDNSSSLPTQTLRHWDSRHTHAPTSPGNCWAVWLWSEK